MITSLSGCILSWQNLEWKNQRAKEHLKIPMTILPSLFLLLKAAVSERTEHSNVLGY